MNKSLRTGLLFISPWIIGFLTLYLGPFLISFSRSFTSWGMLSAPQFVGLKNYATLLTDSRYWAGFGNTFFFVFFGTAFSILIGITIAQLLSLQIPGVKIFRTIFILPILVPAVATSITFLFLYDYSYGMLNRILVSFGFDKVSWLKDASMVKTSLLFITIWVQGKMILIFMASIKGVPGHLYEAADIEGANPFQKFFKITLPQISGIVVLNSIMAMIGYFQIFTEPYIMTQGGPGNASLTYTLYLYNTAFGSMKMGYASAMSTILFIVIMGFTIVYLKLSKKFVYSEV